VATQPIPNVTRKDIERVVGRDFPANQTNLVFSLLSQYGTENWHHEQVRVQIAVLKLAAGNLKRLRSALETACADYRDVLAQAEYPEYFQYVDPSSDTSQDEVQRIIDADWNQYSEWLGR
jgi:hypothetical protein